MFCYLSLVSGITVVSIRERGPLRVLPASNKVDRLSFGLQNIESAAAVPKFPEPDHCLAFVSRACAANGCKMRFLSSDGPEGGRNARENMMRMDDSWAAAVA